MSWNLKLKIKKKAFLKSDSPMSFYKIKTMNWSRIFNWLRETNCSWKMNWLGWEKSQDREWKKMTGWMMSWSQWNSKEKKIRKGLWRRFKNTKSFTWPLWDSECKRKTNKLRKPTINTDNFKWPWTKPNEPNNSTLRRYKINPLWKKKNSKPNSKTSELKWTNNDCKWWNCSRNNTLLKYNTNMPKLLFNCFNGNPSSPTPRPLTVCTLKSQSWDIKMNWSRPSTTRRNSELISRFDNCEVKWWDLLLRSGWNLMRLPPWKKSSKKNRAIETTSVRSVHPFWSKTANKSITWNDKWRRPMIKCCGTA